MKAVIDMGWLDQQIEHWKKQEESASGSAYYYALAAKEVLEEVKAQLSPIKGHIEKAFGAGEHNIVSLNDYLKKHGYET